VNTNSQAGIPFSFMLEVQFICPFFIFVRFKRKGGMLIMKLTKKKISVKILSVLLALFMIAGSSQLTCAATDEVGVQSVRALTDMGWWGQRVTGVVLEFAENVDATKFTAADFAVRDTSFNPYFDSGSFTDPNFMQDQEVVDVFTVADPQSLLENERPAGPGKYVVVMVKPNFNGGTKISVNGGMMANPDQPTEITIGKDIYSTSGEVLANASAEPMKLTGPAIVNRGVDQFVHGVVDNPSVGLPLNYDYRLPDNYNPAKKYPLVVYFNGNGQGYFPAADNIRGQLICDGTPQFWFGEQDVPVSEDVIFLAPQSTRTGQTTDIQAEQAAELIENFSKEFSVDTDRVYGYTLSMGSRIGWWMMQNRADLFAAFMQDSFMPNNQAQADAIAEAEVPMHLFQGQYDHLFGSANAIASYQRIVDAYKAKGLSDERIAELIKITIVPDSGFDAQGPGLSSPSGPFANLIPNLPGPRIDRHAAMVPAFQNPETSKWLLAQSKSSSRLFTITTDGVLNRDGGIRATVDVDVTAGAMSHEGKEVVLFQLMKGSTPVSIVALQRDITGEEEFTAYFNVDPKDTTYSVKTFVFDSFSNDLLAPISLADGKVLN
jgi:predicted peptidase